MSQSHISAFQQGGGERGRQTQRAMQLKGKGVKGWTRASSMGRPNGASPANPPLCPRNTCPTAPWRAIAGLSEARPALTRLLAGMLREEAQSSEARVDLSQEWPDVLLLASALGHTGLRTQARGP